MNVLIVDDEPLAREGMQLLLKEESSITSVNEARNGAEAVRMIRERRPDLVFLDVQMPELDGFGVLGAIGAEHMPPVIFVTAHDQYAIQAFEVNAIDYLLKPVTRERCSQALARVRERMATQGPDNQHVLSLLQQLAAPPKYLKRVALRSAGKISFVNIEDILYVQAAENYVQLHLKAARHLLHVPIATFEGSVDPQMFLRIHRSLIVNVKHIQELETGAHGEFIVVLNGGGGCSRAGATTTRSRRGLRIRSDGFRFLRPATRHSANDAQSSTAVRLCAVAARLGIHEVRGIEPCPVTQRRKAVRVGPFVLRHAGQRRFADTDLACHLPPRGCPGGALGVDRLRRTSRIRTS